MATATTDVRDMVVKVIESCLDGAQGFEAAANVVDDTTYKKELALLGRQRRAFTSQLQILLGTFGDAAADQGALSGAMEQTWMSPEKSLTGDARESVLAACERGEFAAIEAYRLVLEEPLPEVTRQIIASQFRDMVRSQMRVKAMCGATKSA